MIAKLKATCDRKTKFHKNQKNTFGLLPGLEGTCPQATLCAGGCWHIPEGRKLPVCYVANTMNVYKGVYAALQHNTQLLRAAAPKEKVELLNEEFDRFRKVEERRDQPQLNYRLHWAGDIFDQEYAEALSTSLLQNMDITFWAYTRSFFAVPKLCDIPNLTLYLSLDPVNIHHGLMTHATYATPKNKLRVCYMAQVNDFTAQSQRAEYILKEYNMTRELEGLTPAARTWSEGLTECPVDTSKLELEYGCANCTKCLRGTSDVWFKT